MQWRTSDVLAICQGMREAHDYSALPILADALQDADYPDEKMLEELRKPQDDTTAQRLVAVIYSEETAAAVKKVEEIAEEMGPRAFYEEKDGYGNQQPTTYARLMHIGDRWTLWNDYTTEHGSEDLRDGGVGVQFHAYFWEAYRVITGRYGSGNPFSCSC